MRIDAGAVFWILALTLMCGLLALADPTYVVIGLLLILVPMTFPALFHVPVRQTGYITHDENEQLRLADLFVGAVAIRWLVALPLNFLGFNYHLAPDSLSYVEAGRSMAADLYGGPPVVGGANYVIGSSYHHANAIAVTLVGSEWAGLALSFLNGIVAACAFWILAQTVHRRFGARAARHCFALCAFFPSLILWTSMNLREASALLLILTMVNSVDCLRVRFSTKHLALTICAALAMGTVRSYLLIPFGFAIVASFLVVRLRQLPQALASFAIILWVLLLIIPAFGHSLERNLTEHLTYASTLRAGLAFGASAVETTIDTTTPLGALLYLPQGLSTFLLAPLPWNISSWRQAIAAPESLFWYWILATSFREMVRCARERLSDIALPILIIGAISIAYGFVEGNEGTAYRHRAQVVVLFFAFASAAHARRIRAAAVIQKTPPSVRSARRIDALRRPASDGG